MMSNGSIGIDYRRSQKQFQNKTIKESVNHIVACLGIGHEKTKNFNFHERRKKNEITGL